jgi:hypothetical protein
MSHLSTIYRENCHFLWTYILQKMPSAERQAAQTNRLIETTNPQEKPSRKVLRRRKAQLRRSFRLANAQGLHYFKASLESLSEISDISPLSAMSDSEEADLDASNSSDYADWDNILGDNWRSCTGQFDAMSLFEDEDDFSGLLSVGIDSDPESGSSRATGSNHSEGSLVSEILDFDADDELEESDEDLDEENQANHMLGK